MDVNELLIRTMNASREAQENGFYDTAEALDDILDSLLETLISRNQIESEALAITAPISNHIH